MKTLKIFIIIVLSFAMVLSLCSCDEIGDNTPVGTGDVIDRPPVKSDYPVSFGQDTFEAAPESVVSLSPAITDILAHIGATDKLVGISEYCSLPGLELENVGSPAYPDIDRIISLEPELVMTLSPLAATDKIALEQVGIRILVLEAPKSYASLCEMYINLSMVFFGAVDSQDIAYDALSDLDDAMLRAKNSEMNVRFICIEGIYDDGIVVSGKDTLEDDILSVFGENLLGEYEGYYLSEEEAAELDPTAVFLYDTVDNDYIEELFEEADIVYISADAFEKPTADLCAVIEASIEDLK